MKAFYFSWSGRLDSNQRPLAPHANALPGCATSRIPEFPNSLIPEFPNSRIPKFSFRGRQIYDKKFLPENEFIGKPYLRAIPSR